MKDSVLVESVHLTSVLYQLGRQPPPCSNDSTSSLILEHPSLSRLHAVLAYNSAEQCWLLKDMRSTHGTFVNQHPCKEDDFVKVDEGDILQFGHSTRMYTISAYVEDDGDVDG